MMGSLIQLEFPEALGDIEQSHRLPQSVAYRLSYAHCNYWQHSAFTVLEQYYQTKDIFLYLGEVNTDIDLAIKLRCKAANLYWVYQLENNYLLLINPKRKRAQFKTREKTYRAVYLPAGDHTAYFEKGGHHLVFYFVVDKELLLRFQDSSLRYLKKLLEKLDKGRPGFALSLKLPINAYTMRHLNMLLHAKQVDALELEAEIPHLVLRLLVIARQQHFQQQGFVRMEITKLDEIRAYIKENIKNGAIHSIPAIAQQFELSPYQLRFSHKQAFGTSLQAYITDLRLSEAYYLIKVERFKPLQAAYTMGYSDIRSFRKQFLKRHGITPGELYKSG
ncbi:MAG TPA: AraC family transcriptional regulator [Pseudosphingobacterium sp.]|nr:AraC family transcriptional regulator [Pseudosphingobacterium sp.]